MQFIENKEKFIDDLNKKICIDCSETYGRILTKILKLTEMNKLKWMKIFEYQGILSKDIERENLRKQIEQMNFSEINVTYSYVCSLPNVREDYKIISKWNYYLLTLRD